MDYHKLAFLFLIFMVHCSTDVNGQCFAVESYRFTPDTLNEPEFYLSRKSIIAYTVNGLHVKVDTSVVAYDVHNSIRTANNNFAIFQKDSQLSDQRIVQQVQIIHQSSRVNYVLGLGRVRYWVDLDSCFILFYIDLKGRGKTTVFDYHLQSVSSYDLRISKLLGRDGASVYFKSFNFKYKKVKYGYGTIASINVNGINILEPVSKSKAPVLQNFIYYSGFYTVSESLFNQVENNCGMDYHYSIIIRSNNEIIDSFVDIRSSLFLKPDIFSSRDTLIFISPNKAVRQYVSNDILIWQKTDWLDSLPLLKGTIYEFYSRGDLLFLKLKFGKFNSKGREVVNGQEFTINGIPFKKESTIYTVLMAFDIRKNTFLGYPALEFINQNE